MSHLPTTKAIKDILDGLLGRDVVLRPGSHVGRADVPAGVVARYLDDGDRLRAVAAWDLPAGANVGAAVGLFPKGAAQAALEDGYLSGSLLENLSEVSNVLAQAFNVPGAPHVRLADNTVEVLDDAPEDALALLDAEGGERLDFEVSVEDYGAGRLAISMVG
jgi:hypothetical protein